MADDITKRVVSELSDLRLWAKLKSMYDMRWRGGGTLVNSLYFAGKMPYIFTVFKSQRCSRHLTISLSRDGGKNTTPTKNVYTQQSSFSPVNK